MMTGTDDVDAIHCRHFVVDKHKIRNHLFNLLKGLERLLERMNLAVRNRIYSSLKSEDHRYTVINQEYIHITPKLFRFGIFLMNFIPDGPRGQDVLCPKGR
jgi:hypothetical protein